MIDVHSHLIFDVDDGPVSVKESLRMLLEAEKLGIKAIIATPHFNEDLYKSKKAYENFQELVLRTKDCGVELYMGYEVFINSYLYKIVKSRGDMTLNNSKYLLFELPSDSIPVYSSEIVYRLHLDSIIPVIAHPERNRRFVKSLNSFIKFVECGCLVQIDAASIAGVYGNDVRNFAKELIKLDLVDFIASDAHCAEDYKNWYLKAFQQVKRWVGEQEAQKLFYFNPLKILEDAKR